jgi:2-polyprenyl-3-methyl-5-hydroxy-6-metoxy-1,4-benzoquinol methylase
MRLIWLLARIARKILPPKFYFFVSSKIYLPIWESAWKLGLTDVAFGDICQSERATEYPWVLRNIKIENGKILDVGCKGTLFPVLLAGMGFEVWGIDLYDIGRYKSRHPNFRFIKGDVTTAPLPENYFDLITAISTVEHIGLEDDGDFECMKRLARLLKDEGKVIITIPFGKAAQSEPLALRVYDRERLDKIFKGWKIKRTDFFKELEPGKWLPAKESDVRDIDIKHGPERVRSIVCVLATKED